MSAIPVGYGREGFGDRSPAIDTVLREVADDLGGLKACFAALTSSQNSTPAATDLTTTEALANALKTNYNALQADVAAIRTAMLALTIKTTKS